MATEALPTPSPLHLPWQLILAAVGGPGRGSFSYAPGQLPGVASVPISSWKEDRQVLSAAALGDLDFHQQLCL